MKTPIFYGTTASNGDVSAVYPSPPSVLRSSLLPPSFPASPSTLFRAALLSFSVFSSSASPCVLGPSSSSLLVLLMLSLLLPFVPRCARIGHPTSLLTQFTFSLNSSSPSSLPRFVSVSANTSALASFASYYTSPYLLNYFLFVITKIFVIFAYVRPKTKKFKFKTHVFVCNKRIVLKTSCFSTAHVTFFAFPFFLFAFLSHTNLSQKGYTQSTHGILTHTHLGMEFTTHTTHGILLN